MPITQQYKIFSFSLEEGMDEGALVDGLADDLKAALILISSWNTSKGTAGTPDEYCLTVVSPTPPPTTTTTTTITLTVTTTSITLIVILVYYSLIPIARRIHYNLRHFEKNFKEKPTNEEKRILGSK